MALQKQTKQFSFAQGVNTKTTHEILPLGKLHSAENVRFNQSGKLSKKAGSTKFTTTKVAGGNLTAARNGFAHKNGAYAITPTTQSSRTVAATNCSPDDIYSYVQTLDKWQYVCRAGGISAETVPIPKNAFEYTGLQGLTQNSAVCDACYINGYIVTVQSDPLTTNGVVTIIDAATGEAALTHGISGSSAPIDRARVVPFGSTRAILIFGNGTSIFGFNYDTSNLTPPNLAAPIVFANNWGGNKFLDCFIAPHNGNLYVAYSNGSSGISVLQFSSIVTSGTATQAAGIAIAEVTAKCLTIFGGESTFQKIYVAYNKAGTGLRVNICSMSLTGSAIVTATSYEARAVVGATSTNAGGQYVTMIGEFDDSPVDTYLNIAFFGLNASASTLLTTDRQYQLSLASKLYVKDGIAYGLLVNSDPLERTYYLAYLAQEEATGTAYYMLPIAKLLFGQAGFQQSEGKSLLPSLAVAGSYVITVGYKYLVQKDATTALYFQMILRFNFASQNPEVYQNRQASGLTYFTGGFPACFDGRNFFEASFLHSPLLPTTAVGATGAGALTLLGTYQVCTVFEFVDAQGNRHQSAPSVPLSITLTGSQNQFTFKYFSPALGLRNYINVIVYRTTANGTIFYRDSVGFGRPISGRQGASCAISDATLSTQEILYTAGDVIENQCPTAAKGITIWKDRLWYLTDDGIVFSKNITDGFVASFNPALNINSIANKGRPAAIAASRDKLFALYNDDIFYISGDGPSDSGNGAFTPLELVSSGVGCVSSAAAVEMQDLIMFQSRDGWRTLGSSLVLEHVGSEMQNYITESSTVYSAMYFDTLHQVRISDQYRTYVYDTFEKQWTIYKLWADLAGFLWTPTTSATRKYIRIRILDGVVLYENEASFQDESQNAVMLVRTGWITFDNIEGFQRVYEFLILGRYYSNNALTVKVFYNYMPIAAETFTFSPADIASSAYLDSNVYDNDSYTDSTIPFQVRVQPAMQKCEAIRIEIADSYGSGTNQGFDLIGVNFVLGVKNVAAKMRANASAISGAQTPNSGM